MLHLDAGGGGELFREGVGPRKFVDGVRPSVRSERYTKMAELYVVPSAAAAGGA